MQFIIVSLMKSLKSIYDNSNFYKEARIVSFIDRLLDCILRKVKNSMTISRSVLRGKTDFEVFDQELQCAQSVITKFKENFFVANLMVPKQISEEEEKTSNSEMN
jgi:hypothetical protein